MMPRIGETTTSSAMKVAINMSDLQKSSSAANSEESVQKEGSSYFKTKEIDNLAAKFANSGMYTEEASKVLAENILSPGSVDLFA